MRLLLDAHISGRALAEAGHDVRAMDSEQQLEGLLDRDVLERWRSRRSGYWNVESTAYWSEVPLQATLAILLNLYERGELKVDDER